MFIRYARHDHLVTDCITMWRFNIVNSLLWQRLIFQLINTTYRHHGATGVNLCQPSSPPWNSPFVRQNFRRMVGYKFQPYPLSFLAPSVFSISNRSFSSHTQPTLFPHLPHTPYSIQNAALPPLPRHLRHIHSPRHNPNRHLRRSNNRRSSLPNMNSTQQTPMVSPQIHLYPLQWQWLHA